MAVSFPDSHSRLRGTCNHQKPDNGNRKKDRSSVHGRFSCLCVDGGGRRCLVGGDWQCPKGRPAAVLGRQRPQIVRMGAGQVVLGSQLLPLGIDDGEETALPRPVISDGGIEAFLGEG